MTYADYLKQNGATEEDVKLLDTPVGRRTFDAMQAQVTEAERVRALSTSELEANKRWYDEQAMPTLNKWEQDMMAAKANEARAVALIKASTDEGLRKVAIEQGFLTADGAPPVRQTTGTPETWDAKKHNVPTWDDVHVIAEREGMAIAIMGKMIQEHNRLFPDGDLVDWESLRKQATASKRPLESVWMETYKVADARAARVKATQDARDQAIRDAAIKETTEKLASQYGNPDARPLAPSTSPFTQRKETGRDKQPWAVEGGAGALQADRITRTAAHVVKELSKPN